MNSENNDDKNKLSQDKSLHLRASAENKSPEIGGASLTDGETFAEKQKRLYETIINNTPDLVYMFDLNYRFTYANKALLDMWGLTWEQAIGKTLIENGYEAWHAAMHEKEIDEVVSTKKQIRGEVSFPHATLGKRIYDYIFAPIFNENNEVIAIAGTTRDITDIRTAESSLKEKTRQLTELASSLEERVKERTTSLEMANKNLESLNYIASHDLQEPLRKIKTFIIKLQERQINDAAATVYLEKISSSATRMSMLIQAVLDYGQLSKLTGEFTDVDLNDILNHVIQDFELRIDETNAVITNNTLPTIKANALQMRQLFTNLLSNALKFCNNNPVINISGEYVQSDSIINFKPDNFYKKYLYIIFKDNGIGFEPQFSEQIFKLFQRLNGNKEYSGTGIGLSIVKKIIENHHGFITADSQPGLGATFYIWLPVL